MNRETRRLSKIPDEVRNEVTPFYLDRDAIAADKIDHEKIEKLTDETAVRIRPGIAVSWLKLYFDILQNCSVNYILKMYQ